MASTPGKRAMEGTGLDMDHPKEDRCFLYSGMVFRFHVSSRPYMPHRPVPESTRKTSSGASYVHAGPRSSSQPEPRVDSR